MMNKPDHPLVSKRAECPTSSLSGNYEMAAGRNLQVRKPERFALEVNTTIKLFDGCALTNFYLVHPLPIKSFDLCLRLCRTRRDANRRLKASRYTILQHDSA